MVDLKISASTNGCKSNMTSSKRIISPTTNVKKSPSNQFVSVKSLKLSEKTRNASIALPCTPNSGKRSDSRDALIGKSTSEKYNNLVSSRRGNRTPKRESKNILPMRSNNCRSEIGNLNEGSIGGAKWHVKTVVSKNKPIKVYASDDFKIYGCI